MIEGVGQTDDTEPAAKTIEHRLIRRSRLKGVGSTDDTAPDKPTNSNAMSVQLSRAATKRTQ